MREVRISYRQYLFFTTEINSIGSSAVQSRIEVGSLCINIQHNIMQHHTYVCSLINGELFWTAFRAMWIVGGSSHWLLTGFPSRSFSRALSFSGRDRCVNRFSVQNFNEVGFFFFFKKLSKFYALSVSPSSGMTRSLKRFCTSAV